MFIIFFNAAKAGRIHVNCDDRVVQVGGFELRNWGSEGWSSFELEFIYFSRLAMISRSTIKNRGTWNERNDRGLFAY